MGHQQIAVVSHSMDQRVKRRVEKLAGEEHRSRSSMLAVLLREALDARDAVKGAA